MRWHRLVDLKNGTLGARKRLFSVTLSGQNCHREIIVALSSEWEALCRRTGSQRVGPDCRCCRPRVRSMDGTPTSGGIPRNSSPVAACDESRQAARGPPRVGIERQRVSTERVSTEQDWLGKRIGKEEALYPLLESVQATETSQTGTFG